jgi:EAL domain-containing protein (putative c-di-GMP-specific phosphodiesterase class I)/PleD family two-component response regulator
VPAPPKAAARSAATGVKAAAGALAAGGIRAEFPPSHYWRRWCGDAGPPLAAIETAAPEPLIRAVVPQAGADGSPEAPYRVLVVEDDLSQALFAESVLSGAGMQAAVVSVASEVMASMETFQPDLVLMDLHMPGMDGAELTNMIRAHATFAHLPIVFLTGDPDPERQVEVLEIGADDYLAKPVRPRHLIAAVQSRIRRARMLRRQRSGEGRHPVTGLYTRSHMLQLLNTAIPGQTRGAVYFLEIEGTGALRDRFGYAGLETVLTDAGRLLGALAGEQPVSRLSDNVFLIHAAELADSELAAWARTLRDGVGRHQFEVNGVTLRLRTLVGYAPLSHGFDDASSALAAAERALRKARATPVGIAAYQPPQHVDASRETVDAIRQALAENRIEFAFQPVVAVAGGEEAQYQTLLRMRDADGALHAAAEFLPAAETAGLMHEIDQRVLQLAVAVLQRRRRENSPVRLFVAQSSHSLAREGYAEWVIETLAAHDVEGAALVLDVRQDEALIHALALKEFCAAMVPAGIQLCLSQYCAGDEADALLAQLPLGYVRLASRYSTRLDDGPIRDEMRAAIERAHRLGLQVIGQQVEDPQAAATLWMSGVDYIQGNLVQRAAGELDFDFQHSVL